MSAMDRHRHARIRAAQADDDMKVQALDAAWERASDEFARRVGVEVAASLPITEYDEQVAKIAETMLR